MELIPLSKIKLNPANPRTIKDDRFKIFIRSLAQFPKMLSKRGVVVNKQFMALGGNQRIKALTEILTMPDEDLLKILGEAYVQNMPMWQIYRDAQAIPQNWIVDGSDMTDDEIRRFIIADNVEMGEHDYEALKEQWDEEELNDWGLELPDFDSVNVDYTKLTKAPIYEVKNQKPAIKKVYDDSKYKELLDQINEADIEDEVKEFLKLAAARHIVFNYELIADLYAHSEPTVQELFENSALVIIDFQRAIENGYVKLSKRLKEYYEEDYGEE